MILTRDTVNKNIKYHDFYPLKDNAPEPNFHVKDYSFSYMSSLVDAYKNCLLSKGAVVGQSVVIGIQSRVEQIAAVLACSELGIIITIADIDVVEDPRGPVPIGPKPARNKSKQNLIPVEKDNIIIGFITNAFKKMLPIDFFLVKNTECTAKLEIFRHTCVKTILLDDEILDYTPNNTILAKNDSVFLRCAAGSIDDISAVKIIDHTQEFMCSLIKRNSSMFYGKMCIMSNLNHGSSPAVFFLPSLVSSEVTDFYNFRDIVTIPSVMFAKYLKPLDIDHLLVPYTQWIDDFFSDDNDRTRPALDNCTLYTLSIIRKEWLHELGKTVKDIVSIFGNREASGPTMLNKASDTDFAENKYTVYDDFYDFRFTDKNELEIVMPIYGNIVSTKDIFTVEGNKYIFQGSSSNPYRINDMLVNLDEYQKIIDEQMQAELVLDSNKDRIYLAIWDNDIDKSIIRQIDDLMKQQSNGKHLINNYEFLNRENFLVKYFDRIDLDIDGIRNYFRNK